MKVASGRYLKRHLYAVAIGNQICHGLCPLVGEVNIHLALVFIHIDISEAPFGTLVSPSTC